jgi:hypothetical protein
MSVESSLLASMYMAVAVVGDALNLKFPVPGSALVVLVKKV